MRFRVAMVVLIAMVPMGGLMSGCAGPPSSPFDSGPAEVLVWQDISKGAGPYLSRAAAGFRSDNPGVRVSVRWYAREGFLAKVIGAIESGEGPDLVITQSEETDGFVSARAVTAVDFLYRRRRSLLLGAAWGLVERGEHRYGVPLSLATVALFHNADLVPIPPRSSASLLAKTEELFSAGKLGLIAPLRNATYTYPLFASLLPADTSRIVGDAAATYFQLVLDLATAQKLDLKVASVTEDEALAQFLREDAAMAILSQRSFWSLRETKLSYGVVPVPRVSGSPSPGVAPLSGTVALVSSFSEDKQLAADVAASMCRSSGLDGYLRFVRQLPAATSRYEHAPYNGDDARGFLKAFSTPASSSHVSPALLSALSRGLDLVLSQQMSPLGAADASRALLQQTVPES